MDDTVTSGRLAHYPVNFGSLADPAAVPLAAPPVAARFTRRPALALTAEGPRRADLIAWAGAHRDTLSGMRLLAPAGIGVLLAEHCGLRAEPLPSGTLGPAATAGLAAAGDIDAMIAFSDPIELRPGDTTTRSLTRLAVFWDIPIAGNRATADLLLATLTAASMLPQADEAPTADPPDDAGVDAEPEPVRGSGAPVERAGHGGRRTRPPGHPGREPGPTGDQHPVCAGAPDRRRTGRRAAGRGIARALRG